MVEQWPFKPLVQGSSPCTLTVTLPINFVALARVCVQLGGGKNYAFKKSSPLMKSLEFCFYLRLIGFDHCSH